MFQNSNINTIPHLGQAFNCHVGLSDHTMGIGVPLAAITLVKPEPKKRWS